MLKQCYKRWQGDRVAGAGAGIVMEMSASRDLNAHLRAMQCAQRSFTQEMDRGGGSMDLDAPGMLIIRGHQSIICSKDNRDGRKGKHQASFRRYNMVDVI